MTDSKTPPRYGLYAWPYFISVIGLGIFGLVHILLSTLWGNIFLYIGLILSSIGFYLAIAHYIYMQHHLERIEEIRTCLLENTLSTQPLLILDLGSGTGRTSIIAAKAYQRARIIGIDIYSKRTLSRNTPDQAYANALAEGIRDRVCFHFADMRYLPFRDSCFDIITCTSVLHIIPAEYRGSTILEAKRVLEENGIFIILEFLRTKKILMVYWIPAFWIFQKQHYWTTLFKTINPQSLKISKIGDLAIFRCKWR